MKGHAIQETLACNKKHWWFRNYNSVSYLDFSVYRAIFQYFRCVSIYQYRDNVGDVSIPIPCHIYSKKEKDAGKEIKQKNETNTIMHSGSRPSCEGTRLMSAGGTVSHMMCSSDGQQKDDKKRPGGGQGKRKAETRSQSKT